MKNFCDPCTIIQRVTMIIATIIFTLFAVVSFADEAPSKRVKANKNYKTKAAKNSFRTSFSTAYMNSGSGHKAGYTVNLSVGDQRNLLETGLIMNSETNKFDGAQVNYKFYFMPNNRRASLYFQATGVYHNNSPLKDKLNAQVHTSDFAGQAETFNTLEAYAGVGFQQHILANIFIDFSIGLGGYSRDLTSQEDNRSKDFRRYSDDAGVGVNVKFTVGYYLW